MRAALVIWALKLGWAVQASAAQAPLPALPASEPLEQALPAAQPPITYTGAELDRIVSPIALYPDPLLAQVLAAATFPDQVPDAANWADDHHYLSSSGLAAAISEDRLPWDPSVQSLLPFPSVLEMMASDMAWTDEIRTAFLAQRQDVMDAVQRMRIKARDFGYLHSNDRISVSSGPYVEILPIDPAYIVVPYYDPALVFVAPRRGIAIGAAIRFDFGVRLGPVFSPWGWGVTRFAWADHALILNNVRWERTWVNRASYVHPYTARPIEHHLLIPRTAQEREHERHGRPAGHEKHHG
jgi:uncharacterized protein DUF3300